MSSSFLELYREIQGTFPDLPEPQCQRFINRAQRDAFDSWNWSFLAGEGSLDVPASLNGGTITVEQGSQVVVGDATAAAAWLALTDFIPIEDRALKIGTDQPYQILAFDGVDTLYIDRPYPNEDDSGLEYRMYRPYYEPPEDFNRFISVVDTVDSWNLIPGKKKQWLDWIDPQRSNIGGPAQFIAFFQFRRAQTIPAFGALGSTTQLAARQLFELWPAPTTAMSLSAYYKKHGADLVEDEDVSPFTDGLLISRALYHAYRFVQVNMANFAQMKGQRPAWSDLKRDANADYMYELGLMIKQDDNINLASVIQSDRNWFPSSSWLQRHLTWQEFSQAYAGSYSW